MDGHFATDTERFTRTLLGVPDTLLRVAWLDAEARGEPAESLALRLDAVIAESERGEPKAREALVTIALWVAGTARAEELDGLRQAALDRRLHSLQRVIRRVPPPSKAPDRPDRVPDYGAGRELTLGERRNLARRAERDSFDALLGDPHPMVMRELLVNPKTTEDDVVRLAAQRPARDTTLEAIAKTRWLARARVRRAVLFNPGSPPHVALPLVGLCTRAELLELVRSPDVPTIVRITAKELAELRPPLGERDPCDGAPPESHARALAPRDLNESETRTPASTRPRP